MAGATRRGVLLGALLAGPGQAAWAQGRAPVAVSAEDYVAQVQAHDMFQVAAANLVRAAHGANPALDGYADAMITLHNDLTARVREVARAVGLHPRNEAMTPGQEEMIHRLLGTDDEERIRVYLDQQRLVHRAALDLHRGFAERGDNVELRAVAREAMAMVHRQMDHLRQVRAVR